jgi:diguanylate cyclase (GGDEF)-like protein
VWTWFLSPYPFPGLVADVGVGGAFATSVATVDVSGVVVGSGGAGVVGGGGTVRFTGADAGFGAGRETTGTRWPGVTRVREDVAGRALCLGGFGTAGARTTTRSGPGAAATPTAPLTVPAGWDRRRGIRAPPATAVASSNAAIPRSILLMPFPSPADNIPRGTIGTRGFRLKIGKPQLSSFKLKLVAYFVVLSLVPMAATYWGFSTVAGADATRQVTSRQESGLRTALTIYQERVDRAERLAERFARSPALQLALVRHDRGSLRRILAKVPTLYVVGADGLRAGIVPALAARLPVDVVAGSRRLGEVVATVPVNPRFAKSLRAGAAFGSADVLALLAGTRIVASSPALHGNVEVAAGRSATVGLAGRRYRALAGPSLPALPEVRLAALTSQVRIDAADARTRNRLLFGLLACLGLIGVVAYLQGRSIVRNLRRVATAARGIAHGSLGERIPVRGRDEFAALGAAFNEMAEQLEARLEELEAERARVHDALARFGEALAATHDATQLLRIVAETAAEATAARGCRIVAADGSVVASGEAGAEGERLTFPLTAAGERFGTLELVGDSFDEEQRMNAASLASQAVVALENARLHRMVERQALVDGLTGLANRRACSDALQAEASRAERFGTPLSVVLADLDGFKDVNDVHGHGVGDEVLRTFAAVLRETLRESDIAGRWGGEEFLLLLPGADEAGAAQLAERVRVALSSRRIAGAPGLRVSASFGVAEHAAEFSAEQLVGSADGALYRAKRAGKDCVARDGSRPLLTLSSGKDAAIPVIIPAEDEHDTREDASCR